MRHKLALTTTVAAVLAGCSSSPGTGCDAFTNCGAPAGGAVGTAQITQNNALDALREAWFAATAAADVPFLVIATNIGDTSGGVVSSPGTSAKTGLGVRPFVDPFGPTTYNCPASGTFTVDGDVTDMMTVTAGDISNYQADACDSGTGFTVTGDHTLEIVSIVGAPVTGLFAQGQILSFDNWQAVSATRNVRISGDHTGVIDAQSGTAITLDFSGNSISFLEGNSTVAATGFSGNSVAQTVDPFAFSLVSNGNASSSAVQGTFTYFTEETFSQLLGEFPSDGILDIFGTGGSTARLAVFDATTVRIQVDANGSGNHEISVDMSWTAFLDGTGTIAFAPVMPE